jgi:Tol biopolymer transport system component
VLVTSTAHSLYPSDWSADGRTLLLTASGQEESSSRDIYRWSRDTGQLSAVVESPADEVAPRFSPDGRWIAYHADDSGDFEVFVRPASGQALPLRISKDGGLFPAWRGDGRELFFIGRHGGIFAVDVAWGAAPTFGEPKRLFDAPIMVQDAQQAVPFDVTPDGQRFVAVVLNHQGASLTYVRNLQSLLERASRRP